MSDVLLALTTVGSAAEAERLASVLVEGGHAACVNVVPGVRSVYRWQGAVHRDEELLLVVKTTAAAFSGLKEALLAAHPYELPELVALPVADGHAPYLGWVRSSVELEAPPEEVEPPTASSGASSREDEVVEHPPGSGQWMTRWLAEAGDAISQELVDNLNKQVLDEQAKAPQAPSRPGSRPLPGPDEVD